MQYDQRYQTQQFVQFVYFISTSDLETLKASFWGFFQGVKFVRYY